MKRRANRRRIVRNRFRIAVNVSPFCAQTVSFANLEVAENRYTKIAFAAGALPSADFSSQHVARPPAFRPPLLESFRFPDFLAFFPDIS
jgi:glutathione peroxidase-family protein